MKFIKSFVLAFIVLTATTSIAFAQSTTQKTDSTKTVTIKVKGVTCNNDLKTLSTNVNELKGVSECKSGKAGPVSEFQVTFNPALISVKEIYKAIENTGGCSDPKDRPYKVKTN